MAFLVCTLIFGTMEQPGLIEDDGTGFIRVWIRQDTLSIGIENF